VIQGQRLVLTPNILKDIQSPPLYFKIFLLISFLSSKSKFTVHISEPSPYWNDKKTVVTKIKEKTLR